MKTISPDRRIERGFSHPTARGLRAAAAHRNRTLVWTLAIAFVLVSLYVLGLRTLVPPDEGRYAEMAREMFASGDWITTRLNGIKYFEKPPLQTWMTALSFSLFGLGEWQARLWTGLCGLLGVGLTALTGLRLYGGRVGLYGALALGSSFYWVACSQIDSLDMGLSGMMTVALCGLLLAQRDGATLEERRNWMLACWAGMALAVLSKGLIGIVLPGGVLVTYMVAARDWALWRRLHAGKGLLLFAAIAVPWFVLVGLHNPEQPHFFFVHEHFDRFLLKEHHREAAWWIFIALLAAGSIPWLGVLVQSLWAARRGEEGRFQPRLLLLIWVVFIVAFFSKSSSKLPGYILPVFPAVALLIGHYLATATRRHLVANAASVWTLGLVLMALVPFATRFSKRVGEIHLYEAYQPWVLGAGIAALAGGTLALYWAATMRRDRLVIGLAVAGFVATQLLLAGFEPIGQARAGVTLLPALKDRAATAARIYSVGIYEQSLTFYLQRPVTLVDYRDEFDFGLQQQPELALATVADFVRQWRDDTAQDRAVLAIIHNDMLDELRRQGLDVHIVAADERRTVIANR
jgi:4-amino-4-deoxy-L-arabinose transferase-like glycosyltransferase